MHGKTQSITWVTCKISIFSSKSNRIRAICIGSEIRNSLINRTYLLSEFANSYIYVAPNTRPVRTVQWEVPGEKSPTSTLFCLPRMKPRTAPKTQIPASAYADTCISLRRYLHEATQVPALKTHLFFKAGAANQVLFSGILLQYSTVFCDFAPITTEKCMKHTQICTY